MKDFLRQLAGFPHFLYLLPLFFIFHGYSQHPDDITVGDFFGLLAEYLAAAGALFLIGYLVFKNWRKASLFSFSLLAIHLFFGAVHDTLQQAVPGTLFVKYIFLLPAIVASVLILLIYLKKKQGNFSRFFLYLTSLFLVLILVDVPPLFRKAEQQTGIAGLAICDTCKKPDVYLILADEYADSTALAEFFGFNNGPFLRELRRRGFHISKTRSNYNYTPFSIASLLKMDYLTGLEGRSSSYADRLACARAINRNPLLSFFEKSGYEIKNNSIYKLNNIPTKAPYRQFSVGVDFIASHTLLSRVRRDLGYHLITTFRLRSVIDDRLYSVDKNNKLLLQRLQDDVQNKSKKSKFVYTHLHMPHYPYYYKKDGTPNPVIVEERNSYNKAAYLEYLQYGNKIYLSMIDEILQKSASPPVIIFMSDHGFRLFDLKEPGNRKYHFMNLNTVYIPSGDYRRFYDGRTTVNQFRTVLNTAFGQHLPILKDSLILIGD